MNPEGHSPARPDEHNVASAGEVVSSLGEAASQLGSFMSTMIEEQPGVTLAAAAAAGFVMGGGLNSSLGSRITTSTVRATLGNVATLVALDLLRRAVDGGSRSGSSQSAGSAVRAE
jgi:hypothetical protein